MYKKKLQTSKKIMTKFPTNWEMKCEKGKFVEKIR